MSLPQHSLGLVRNDEAVDEGQALCEIWCETSRDVILLPSPYEGTVERLVIQDMFVKYIFSTKESGGKWDAYTVLKAIFPEIRKDIRLKIMQEFFDADDGGTSPSRLLSIRRSSEYDDAHDEQLIEHGSDAESDTSSDAGDDIAKSMFEACIDRIFWLRLVPNDELFTHLWLESCQSEQSLGKRRENSTPMQTNAGR